MILIELIHQEVPTFAFAYSNASLSSHSANCPINSAVGSNRFTNRIATLKIISCLSLQLIMPRTWRKHGTLRSFDSRVNNWQQNTNRLVLQRCANLTASNLQFSSSPPPWAYSKTGDCKDRASQWSLVQERKQFFQRFAHMRWLLKLLIHAPSSKRPEGQYFEVLSAKNRLLLPLYESKNVVEKRKSLS